VFHMSYKLPFSTHHIDRNFLEGTTQNLIQLNKSMGGCLEILINEYLKNINPKMLFQIISYIHGIFRGCLVQPHNLQK
jgi:hypothetical protein